MNFNGVVSFGTEGFTEYYGRPFPFQSPPLVATFWDDIDSFFWEGLYYRQTNDSDLLQLFHNYTLPLKNGDSETELPYDYYPTHLFIATWNQVPPYTYFLFGVRINLVILFTNRYLLISSLDSESYSIR